MSLRAAYEQRRSAASSSNLISEVYDDDISSNTKKDSAAISPTGVQSSTLRVPLAEQVKGDILRRHILALADEATFYELAKHLPSNPTLSYEGFLKLSRDSVPDIMKKYFTASMFLMLSRNENGHIMTEDLLRFIQRSMDVDSTLLHLLRYAKNGLLPGGYIVEQELERYLFNSIPEISGYEKMPSSFHPYYVFTSVRRFFFFLDSKRAHRINIKKLGHSTVMEELLYMKRLSQVQKDMSPIQMSTNWFSGNNAMKLYSIFVDLDKDKNGVLSIDEMMQFGGTPEEPSQLTRAALEKIFEVNITFSPMEMDYKAFLDLCLALENKAAVESMTYFWRALDIEKCGRLTPNAISFFYRGIYESLRNINYDAPSPANIQIEVFDMLGCNDPRGPTFNDLVKSGQGHVVFSLLLDCNGFLNYDNRESLMQQQNKTVAANCGNDLRDPITDDYNDDDYDDDDRF